MLHLLTGLGPDLAPPIQSFMF